MTEYYERRALVLDLDGTIRYNKTDPEGFINGPETVAVYDDVTPVLRKYIDAGHLIFGVTNQGGVAYGHKSVFQAAAENHEMCRILAEQLGLADRDPFDAIMICPFMAGGTVPQFSFRSLLRKPQIGMLAVIEYDMYHNHNTIIDWSNSIVVGDRREDCELANKAHTAWIDSDVFFGRSK